MSLFGRWGIGSRGRANRNALPLVLLGEIEGALFQKRAPSKITHGNKLYPPIHPTKFFLLDVRKRTTLGGVFTIIRRRFFRASGLSRCEQVRTLGCFPSDSGWSWAAKRPCARPHFGPSALADLFSALQFTTWALMRLVVPLALSGTPAVMTTVSPVWTMPSFRAVSTQRENSRSVESTEP